MNVGVDPSKVVITKLKMDADRKKLLARKAAAKTQAKDGKFSATEAAAMADVD